MFIYEIWLFDWYFPHHFKSDMLKYGYLESVSESPFDFEITRVDCTSRDQNNQPLGRLFTLLRIII